MASNKNYALVTGATSGFGNEFAKLAAADRYNLVIVARTSEALDAKAKELSSQYGVDVVPIAKDLFDPNAAREVYDEVKSKGLRVDVLINDAGQGGYGKFVEMDVERDLELINLNIVSLVTLTKLFLKDMVQRNEGKILQVSSLLGQVPSPYMAVYSGTKAFVLKFGESVMQELKGTNVTMTVLQPGAGDTDFFHKAGAEATKEYQESSLSKPEDVAKDGYDAMMSGESKIICGLKNKIMGGMSNVMPESMMAANMAKHMQETDERNRPVHNDNEN